MEPAIPSHIQCRKYCYALTQAMLLNVIRELSLTQIDGTWIFSFDGQYFQTAGSSKVFHDYTLGLGNYMNQALTTGCYGSTSCHVKTELLNVATLEWSNGPDYPFASWVHISVVETEPFSSKLIFRSISYYSTAATFNSTYIIGGWQNGSHLGCPQDMRKFSFSRIWIFPSCNHTKFFHKIFCFIICGRPIPIPERLQNFKITNGGNLVILCKSGMHMIPSRLVWTCWLLVDTQTPGKFQKGIVNIWSRNRWVNAISYVPK